MNNILKGELKKLISLVNTKDFDDYLDKLHKKYEDNIEAKKYILDFIKEGIVTSGKGIDRKEQEVNLKTQISEIAKIVSLSYIAKKYFGKTRYWLYQRINGNIVNGRVAHFTEKEIEILNFAFKDIGKKIGSFSVVH
jgi:hypothetical protein